MSRLLSLFSLSWADHNLESVMNFVGYDYKRKRTQLEGDVDLDTDLNGSEDASQEVDGKDEG